MDAELRQVLTVLVTVVGTFASTILGLVFSNRWAAARARMEMEERERQRREETEEKQREWRRETEEKREEWVRATVLAPLAEERRKAHAEVISLLMAPRRLPVVERQASAVVTGTELVPPTADEIQRACSALAHIHPGQAEVVRQWAEASHWGMHETAETKAERARIVEILSRQLDPKRVMRDDPVVSTVLAKTDP